MIIPSYHDPEGEAVTASISEPVLLSGVTPITIALTNPNLITIRPASFTEVGTHTIKIILVDPCGNILSHDLLITVTNSAPYFTFSSPPTYTAGFNTNV